MTGEELLTKIVLTTAGQQDFYDYSKDLSKIAHLLRQNRGILKDFNMFYETYHGEVGNPSGNITELDILTKGSTSMTYELRVINPLKSLFYEVL